MRLLILLLLSEPCFATSPVRRLLNENRLEEALPICRQYEVLSSTDRDNFLTCAWVFLGLEKIESAEKAIEKVTKTNASLDEVTLLQGYISLKKKNPDKAKEIFDNVQSTAKGTALGLVAQEMAGEYYETKGQLSTSAFIYNQIVKEDDSRARAHWGLGRYYLSKDEPRKAERHLLRTISLWPKHMASRFNLAVLYLNEGNLVEAAKYLAECYKLNRSDADVLEQIGNLLEKKNKISEAIKHWQKALEIKPDSVVSREKISKHFTEVVKNLFEKRKYNEALTELERKKTIVNRDPQLKLIRGQIHKEKGDFENAVVDLRAYLKEVPNDAKAMQDLGVCYLNMTLLDQAGMEFEKASKLEPENGLHYAWLAYVLEAKNDLPTAQVFWRKALEHLKDAKEIERANRKLSSIDKKLGDAKKKKKKREQKEKKNEYDDDEEEQF